MAFQMAYLGADGTQFTQSYWQLESIQVDAKALVGQIFFVGYKDQASEAAGLSSVGVKIYNITATDFQSHFTTQMTILSQCYAYALTVFDTDGISFFANATTIA